MAERYRDRSEAKAERAKEDTSSASETKMEQSYSE